MTFNELKTKIEDWPNMFTEGGVNYIPVRDVLDLIEGSADPDEKLTPDTRKALEIIEPVADLFNVWVSADQDNLYCDGESFNIMWNSTRATVRVFLKYLAKQFS